MINFIFLAIFLISGVLALVSLRDLKIPPKPTVKIKRKEKRGMFGVIMPPRVPRPHATAR